MKLLNRPDSVLILSLLHYIPSPQESGAEASFGEKHEHTGNYVGDDHAFYSADEQDAEMRKNILSAALEHVPELGWSSEAIEAGAQSVGLSAMAEGMFSRGAGDLVLHFTEDCNVRLADYLVSQSRVGKESKEDTTTSPV